MSTQNVFTSCQKYAWRGSNSSKEDRGQKREKEARIAGNKRENCDINGGRRRDLEAPSQFARMGGVWGGGGGGCRGGNHQGKEGLATSDIRKTKICSFWTVNSLT